MARPFIAHPPASQDVTTYRQFVELQQRLEALEEALRPSFGSATTAPLTLTDAYQPVTIISGALVLSGQGIYVFRWDVAVNGNSGNAEVQARLIVGGAVQESIILSIGVNLLTPGVTFFAAQAEEVVLEARGIAAELLEGQIDAYRIGLTL